MSEAGGAVPTSARTLVAGFGNLLLGDDGFGVRVIQRLSESKLPEGVSVLEAGTGGMNLLVTLMDGFERLILVDVVRRGVAPGTVFSFRPGDEAAAGAEPDAVDPHVAEPTRAIRAARALRLLPPCVIVVGCEPESCELGLELSPIVQAAVEPAAETVLRLLSQSVAA